MSKIRSIAFLSAFVSALIGPVLAQAGAYEPVAGRDTGSAVDADRQTSGRTRGEVLKELERAKADGRYDYRLLDGPPLSRDAGPGKTRAQVIDELVNMSPEERVRMEELYGW